MPELLEVAVYVGSPFVKVPLAPLDGAVKVTEAFATALPPASFTKACSGPANGIPTVTLWPDPPDTAMLAGFPDNTVNEKLFEVTPLRVAVIFA